MTRLLLFPILAALCGFSSAEVSRDAPEWYAEFAKGRLTGLEEVLGWEIPQQLEDGNGVVLLSEVVSRVRSDGGRDLIQHLVYKALTKSGAEAIGRRRFSFTQANQKIHFIGGRTILPDGSKIEVPSEGVFLQREEGDEDTALYGDRLDLVVIFPDVKAGSIVEMTVLREDVKPLVEGNFSGYATWDASWPIARRRFLVGVEEPLAAGFKTNDVGQGCPKAVRKTEDGYGWWEWVQKDVQGSRYEANSAPVSQTGPATWFTTFDDWEEMGAWYYSLLESRRKLSPELVEAAKKALEGKKTEREKLDALYALVSREVRYVGLGFGLAGLQPYDCSEVWMRKYGDCKDKSNLLVTLLDAHGIEAWLGLVETSGPGKVIREMATTSAFNHAIVVAKPDGGELVFCDPTIEYGVAGEISPATGDRDVLLVDKEGSRFVKSPDVSAGSYHYDFKMELDGEGRLSGWMTRTARGYYRVGMAGSYDGMDRESIRRSLEATVEGFFEGATVVDVLVPEDLRKVGEEVSVKAFFTTPPRGKEGGRQVVDFPSSGAILMDFGPGEDRKNDFFMWRDRIRVTMSLKPERGLVPVSLPEDLGAESPGYGISAGWKFENGELNAELTVVCKQGNVAAADVPAAARVERVAVRWFSLPVRMEEGEDWKAEEQTGEISLPVMPTGDGQLDLVNRWYELGRENELRIKALEKVMRLFSDDPQTVYKARSALAYTHYNSGRIEKALGMFTELSEELPRGVGINEFTYAKYMRGCCEVDLDKPDSAVETFSGVIEEEGVTDFRKRWSLLMRASLALKRGDFASAAADLEATEKIAGDAEEYALDLFLRAYLGGGREADAVLVWRKFEERMSEEAFSCLEDIGTENDGMAGVEEAALVGFFNALESALKDDGKSARIRVLREKALHERNMQEVNLALHRELKDLLSEGAPGYFGEELFPKLATREKYAGVMAGLKKDAAAAWLKHSRAYVLRFEPDGDFTEFLWDLMRHVHWAEKKKEWQDAGWMEKLSGICGRIPRQDDYYWECQFTLAGWHQEAGRWEEAVRIFAAMPDDTHFNPEFAQSAYLGWGIALEKLGKWEESIAVNLKLSDKRMESGKACEMLWRAGVAQALIGEEAEALKTWGLLLEVPATVYEDEDTSNMIDEAVLLAGEPEKAMVFWKQSGEWWRRDFRDFMEKSGLEFDEHPGLADMGTVAAVAKELGKDAAERDAKLVGKHLNQIAFSARWLTPYAVSLYQAVGPPFKKAMPGAAEGMDSLLAEYGEMEIAGGITNVRYFKRLLVAILIDLKDERALEKAIEIYRQAEKDSGEAADDSTRDHFERICYLMGLASELKGEEYDLAAGVLGKIVSEGPRSLTSGLLELQLAKILNLAGRQDEMIAMVETALEGGKIADEASLREFLRSAKEAKGVSAALLNAVAQMEAGAEMGWLAEVLPGKTGEAGFTDPSELFDGTGQRHALEQYKWRKLLLENRQLDSGQSAAAFEGMVDFHLGRCTVQAEVDGIYDRLLSDESLPEDVRVRLHWFALVDAAYRERNAVRISDLAKKPLHSKLRDDLREEVTADFLKMVELMAAPPADVLRDVKGWVAEGEISQLRAEAIATVISVLVDRKLFKEAEELADVFCAGDFAKDAGASGGRLAKLRLIKTIRGAEADFRKSHQLFGIYGKTLVEMAGRAPVGWEKRRNFEYFPDLGDEDELAVRAAMLNSNFRSALRDWSVWAGVIAELVETGDAAQVKGFLESIAGWEDQDLAARIMISGISGIFESRREGAKQDLFREWTRGLKSGALKRLAHTCSETYELAGLGGRELGLLRGRHIRHAGIADMVGRGVTARILEEKGAADVADKFLDAVPEEEYFEPHMLVTFRRLCLKAERGEEAELLAEEMPAEMKRIWMDAWMRMDSDDFGKACEFYDEIGSRTGDVPAWLAKLPDLFPMPEEKIRNRIAALVARRDWEGLGKELPGYEEACGDEKEDTIRALGMILSLGRGETKRIAEIGGFFRESSLDLPYRRVLGDLLRLRAGGVER